MKKNTAMRIASLVLICTIITSCFVSTTFAKYTSEFEGTATATIANWDVQVTDANGNTTIAVDLGATVLDTLNDQDETDVDDGLIAPGTKGSFVIKVKNASEVTADIAVAEKAGNTLPDGFTFTITGGTARLAAGASTDVTVDWEWTFGADRVDNDLAGDDLTASFVITADQVD